MAALPALAISGSNGAGALPFSAAVRHAGGVALALPDASERADLAVLVRRACAAAGIRCGDVAEVRVDRGPGSYVGLRVAVTLARCLGEFVPARVCTTDSLSLAAAGALQQDRELSARRLRPVADGRRQRLHAAALTVQGGVLVAEEEPAWIEPELFARSLEAGDLVLAPTALHPLLADAVARAGATMRDQPPAHAGHLFASWLRLQETALDALEPLYLMGSYAQPDAGPAP
jgi:tRNA A37 threonylcarbamoyladenosine modification protein TsaB